MNTVVKTFIIGGIFLGLGVIIQSFIGSQFTAQLNTAMISFLVMIKPVDFIIQVSTVYACMQILGNFLFGVSGFFIIRWIVHLYAA